MKDSRTIRVATTLKSVVLVILSLSLCLAFTSCNRPGNKGQLTKVRYGITPYQDSALPVVAESLGWYEKRGIDIELVPVTWGDAMTALSSGSIDVIIYNFNSFQGPYENAALGNRKPVFYAPLYVFKGQAIMVHSDSGLKSFKDIGGESEADRKERLAKISRQLKGKRIAVTEGTELEQIVLEALKIAKLDREKDVTIIHAAPEDALAAFLSKDVDAFAAGLTERVEARRHGANEFLVTSDVMLPVIDGIITTKQFADKNPEVMEKLVTLWFDTIVFMEEDLESNSKHILDYLAKAASTKYSPEEYKIAWTFNIFPKSSSEAESLFNQKSSPYYWKRAWDANNEYLLKEGKIKSNIPYDAYWGEDILRKMTK